MWVYSISSWSEGSTVVKLSLANTLAGGSLALAGIILVLVGLSLGLRDPALFGHKLFAGSLVTFFVLIPVSLISAFSALIYELTVQDPFLFLSLSSLFLAGILLLVATTVMIARQV